MTRLRLCPRLSPDMFGCLSVGEVLPMVQVSSSLMSLSNAPNEAKAAPEIEKTRERDVPSVQTTTTTSYMRKTEEDDEEEEEEEEGVGLRMPVSFDFGFGDHGSGAVRETLGVCTVDSFDVIGMLGSL